MEANKDASRQYRVKGEMAMKNKSYKEAARLFAKSHKMYPNPTTESLLSLALSAQCGSQDTDSRAATVDSQTSFNSTTASASSSPDGSPPAFPTGDQGRSRGVRYRGKVGHTSAESSESESTTTSTNPPQSSAKASRGAYPASAPNDSTQSTSPGARTKATTTGRGSTAPRAPPPSHTTPARAFTKDQERLVVSVVSAKSHYEALSVSKTATEEEIKKAYRKLALQLHPDKNGHPRAEEAFKSVSSAFQLLTDSEKRHMYDTYGTEDPQATHVHSADVLNPEDLFNLFFGIHHGSAFHRRVRVHHQHQQSYHNQQQQNPEMQPKLAMLILMLGVITLMSMFMSSPQSRSWDFHQSSEFPIPRKTKSYKVPYYVNPQFDAGYRRSYELDDLETDIERNVLRANCDAEYRTMQQQIHYINMKKPDNAAKEIAELRSKGTPSCSSLRQLTAKAGRGRHRSF